MIDPIKAHIASLRSEIQRKYDEGMKAIDVLESTLVGNASGDTRRRPVVVAAARSARGSNVDVILDAIKKDFLTIEEIAAKTGLPTNKVKYALYQKRTQRAIESRKIGKKGQYRVRPTAPQPAAAHGQPHGHLGVTDAVRKVLRESSRPLKLREVADLVESIATTNARNIRTAVGATLSNLKSAGELVRNEDGTYRVAH